MHLLVTKSGNYLVVPFLYENIGIDCDLKTIVNVFEKHEISINNDIITITYANPYPNVYIVVNIKNEYVDSILCSLYCIPYKSLEDIINDILPMY